MRVFNSNFSFRKYSKMRSFGSGPCGLPPYGVIKRSKGLSAARHLAHVFAVRLASDDDDMASRRCTRLMMAACPRLHTRGTRPSLFCW